MGYDKYVNLFLLFFAVVVGFGLFAYLGGSSLADMTPDSAEANATTALVNGTGIIMSIMPTVAAFLALLFVIFLLTQLVKRGR